MPRREHARKIARPLHTSSRGHANYSGLRSPNLCTQMQKTGSSRLRRSGHRTTSRTNVICRFIQTTRGGSNGALREQATTGREASFRVESRHPRGCRLCRRVGRPADRRVGGTKETTSNTAYGRGSGRYANSPRARRRRQHAGASVRRSPGHGVGQDTAYDRLMNRPSREEVAPPLYVCTGCFAVGGRRNRAWYFSAVSTASAGGPGTSVLSASSPTPCPGEP